VADLESLARDTHKFESRYEDRLVGPLPEALATYRERSPVHAFDRISCPVLVLQGLEDRVVPPSQARRSLAALKANGIPHAYLAFEGEGHGFRGAEAIRRTIEARLSFLGQVFGFEPSDEIPQIEVPGIEPWRDRVAATRAEHAEARRAAGERRRWRSRRPLMEISPIELVLGLLVVPSRSGTSHAGSGSPIRSSCLLGGLVLGFLLACPTSSSTRTSSSYSSCRPSSSGPATRRRSATSRPTRARSRCWRSASCCSRRSWWASSRRW
jgi:hypothetical protein